jgi:hypothetical protein
LIQDSIPSINLSSLSRDLSRYNAEMRRSLALLVLAIVGCGQPSQPTPHEKYMSAAAEFARENGRLAQLSASKKDARRGAIAIREFFRLFTTAPFVVDLPAYPATSRRRDSMARFSMQIYDSMPVVVAAQKQFELVEELRGRERQARIEWVQSQPGYAPVW